MSGNAMQNVAFVALFLLLCGVCTGWLGGL